MASFEAYKPLLLQVEGGYQAHPEDSGNYNSLGQLVGTKYGISAPVYETYINRPPSVSDMKAITKNTALQIYKINYWDASKGDYFINQSVANLVVDHAVNAGVGAAGKLVQRTLNNEFGYNLAVDGVIGNATMAAINNAMQDVLHARLLEAREAFYLQIGGPFVSGWLYRLSKFVFDEKKKCCSECGRPL